MSERGQSETVGFVLVFSMIVVTTGVVYAAGFGALSDVRETEQLDNVERAFEVLDHNLEDISRRGAPSRATEVDLSGGTLSTGNGTTITVETRYPNGTVADTWSRSPRPIVYESGETTVTYVAGAVIRRDSGGTIMHTEPDWLVSEERLVVSLLVTVPGDGRTAMGGDTTVQVTARRDRQSLAVADPTGDLAANVTVTVESPSAGAWKRYLESAGFTAADADPSDGTVVYWLETDEVYGQETAVSVELRP